MQLRRAPRSPPGDVPERVDLVHHGARALGRLVPTPCSTRGGRPRGGNRQLAPDQLNGAADLPVEEGRSLRAIARRCTIRTRGQDSAKERTDGGRSVTLFHWLVAVSSLRQL